MILDPSIVKQIYQYTFQEYGEIILIRRYFGNGANRNKFDVEVKARIKGYTPDELIGTIIQGDQKIIVLVEDLIKMQFKLPIQKGDKAVVRGKELNIESVDGDSRKIGSTLIAYEIQSRG